MPSREAFRNETGRKIKYDYFAGNLLVKYMHRHRETDSWKITADPRGTLVIPNARNEVRIPCGTIAIDDYLSDANHLVQATECNGVELPKQWPSLRWSQRYQAVLYIEKEGFEPLFQEAKIAERFDLAIMSCKGQSVVAARKFVDEVCGRGSGVPLFVVHDFDKYGFEIAQCLTQVSRAARANDRVTYQFQNEVNVTDLGLRLADVEEYGLADESTKEFNAKRWESIATPEEREFLASGRRVELNAFTSPQFIEWLESKLTEHLGGKRLIPTNNVLTDAYRRALVVSGVNEAIKGVVKDARDRAENAMPPQSLKQQLEKVMGKQDIPWDQALYEVVAKGRPKKYRTSKAANQTDQQGEAK